MDTATQRPVAEVLFEQGYRPGQVILHVTQELPEKAGIMPDGQLVVSPAAVHSRQAQIGGWIILAPGWCHIVMTEGDGIKHRIAVPDHRIVEVVWTPIAATGPGGNQRPAISANGRGMGTA